MDLDGTMTRTRKKAERGEGRCGDETSRKHFDTCDERIFVNGKIDAGDFVVLHLNDARLRPTDVGTGGYPSTESKGKSRDSGTAKTEGEKRSGWFHGLEITSAPPSGLLRRTACRHARRAYPPLHVNIDLLRSFFEIATLGSLNKAAERLRVSQSTLTRQMHALEHDIGGALFERSSSGVSLTATGHVLLDGMKPLLTKFDAALGEVRKIARGQSTSLRVGYISSAAQEYLNPALAALRRAHPEVKVKLLDQSPGEQLEALRQGEIDVALMGRAGASTDKEFYAKRLATLPLTVAVAETHPLAGQSTIALAELRGDLFVGANERDLPGHNPWITQICRKAGFRARFVEDAESLSHGLSLVVTEGAVSLIPEYAKKSGAPGVRFVPLKESALKWTLVVTWQRGRISAPLRVLLDAMPVQNAR